MNDIVPPANNTQDTGNVNNLRQLMNRQANLTDRMLDSPSQSTFSSPRPHQPTSHHFQNDQPSYDRQRSYDTRSYDSRSHDVSYDDRSRYGGGEMDERSVDTGFDEDPFNNNSMVGTRYE